MTEKYEYQPQALIDDFDQATDVLARKIANRVIPASPTFDQKDIDGWCEQLHDLGIGIRDERVDLAAYNAFTQEAAYQRLHPDYYPGNLPEKSFEHHLACRWLELQPGDVFIDAASESGVLPEIVTRLFGARSYAQDMMYAHGVADGRIGGDACEMPVPAGFASKVALTCSFEHFEGDGDTRLFRELSRVLPRGGRVLVVPLYMFGQACAITDPLVSTAANVAFDQGAVVYCVRGWRNRHGRFYSPETLVRRVLAPNSDAFRFSILRILGTEAIDASIYARLALLAERI